jgi:iron complex outermembrane receptor protein
LSFNYNETDGQREIVAEDAQTQYDKLYGTHASLAPGEVNLSHRNWDIDLHLAKKCLKFHTYYQKRDHVGFGTGVSQALDPEGLISSDRLYSDLTYDNPQLAENWGLTIRTSYADVDYLTGDFVAYPPGAFGGTFPEGMRALSGVAEQQINFDVTTTYRGVESHQIRLGMGYHYGKIDSVTDKRNFGMNPKTGQPIAPTRELTDISNTEAAFIPTGDRKNYHLFVQDMWKLNEKWEITSGIRYDRYSDFGSTINPRLALVWKVTPDFVTKLLYGKAFRAPSFQELYQVNNPVALGNVDLKPEKIQTYEIALSYRPSKKWHVGTNLFTYRLTDKILFVPDENAEHYYAENDGSQKGYGIVLEGDWQFVENLVFMGNYAFQTAKNQLDDQIANVPKQDIYLRADWKFAPHWHLNTQANWIMDRKRASDDPRPAIDDNFSMDLTLHYQSLQSLQDDESAESAKSGWNVTFAVRNLFDSDLREPSSGPDENGKINIPYDLPLPGIHYFIGFNYHF